jgi:type VI protein secretion system component Hcp
MAIDLFMQLKGANGFVKGESTDDLCPEMIQLQSFSMSVFAAESDDHNKEDDKKKDKKGSSVGASKKSTEPVSFTIIKGMDTSTTALFLNYFQAATAKPIPFEEAVVYFRYPTMMPAQLDTASFLIFTFEKLFVCQYTMEFEVDEENATRPKETVQFSFESYQMSYRTESGTVGSPAVLPMGWNFVDKQKA